VKASFEDFSKFQEENQQPQELEAVGHDSLPVEGTSKAMPSMPAILFLREVDQRVRERESGHQDHI